MNYGEAIIEQAEKDEVPLDVLEELDIYVLTVTFLNCFNELGEPEIKKSFENYKSGNLLDSTEFENLADTLFKNVLNFELNAKYADDQRLINWLEKYGEKFFEYFQRAEDKNKPIEEYEDL